VLRGGYGIFYARTPGGLINTLHLENGVYQKQLTFNSAVPADLAIGPVFPNKLASVDRNPPAGTIDISVPDKNLRNPYTQQGDVGIEHELTRDLGITASYLWSRGVQLYTVRDLNIGALGPDVTYRINDAAGNQVGTYSTPTYRLANRVDTRWRSVNQIENGGRSFYDAMVLQMRKRFSKMWEGSIAYTWSHAIDYNQGGGNDNIFYSGRPRSLFNGDFKQDKSSSSLDQRHRIVGSAVITPTFTKKTDKFSKYVVNGWQLSNIFTGASTQPQTQTIFVSGNPFAGAAFPGSLNGFGGSSRVPFVPAANLFVDTIVRLDSRLSKIIAITERYQLFLNFEAFNVFNHVSNTAVNGQAFQATNGVLSVTPRLGEGSASQGFPDGTNARRAQLSVRFVF
jgi:hypothetical protein